jgi:hypothetical protein
MERLFESIHLEEINMFYVPYRSWRTCLDGKQRDCFDNNLIIVIVEFVSCTLPYPLIRTVDSVCGNNRSHTSPTPRCADDDIFASF